MPVWVTIWVTGLSNRSIWMPVWVTTTTLLCSRNQVTAIWFIAKGLFVIHNSSAAKFAGSPFEYYTGEELLCLWRRDWIRWQWGFNISAKGIGDIQFLWEFNISNNLLYNWINSLLKFQIPDFFNIACLRICNNVFACDSTLISYFCQFFKTCFLTTVVLFFSFQ